MSSPRLPGPDPNDIALNPALDALSPPRRVRVIRVLEYDYPDQDTAEADMANWGMPPNGVRYGFGGGRFRATRGTVIRSATTFPETLPHHQEEHDDRTGS